MKQERRGKTPKLSPQRRKRFPAAYRKHLMEVFAAKWQKLSFGSGAIRFPQ